MKFCGEVLCSAQQWIPGVESSVSDPSSNSTIRTIQSDRSRRPTEASGLDDVFNGEWKTKYFGNDELLCRDNEHLLQIRSLCISCVSGQQLQPGCNDP